jgi:hypothetical protein
MPGRILGILIACYGLLCSVVVAQGSQPAGQGNPSGAAAPPINSIVSRIQQAQIEARPQVPYQEIRKYRIFPSNNSNAASEVVAEVEFRLPSSKNYFIQQRSGSTRAEEVVRRILDHEVQAAAQGGHVPPSAVMQGNYDFSYLGEAAIDGQPCYVLQLNPKRKDKNLIAGKAWVDSQSFLVRQIEGDLVKSPSWWIKKVHVKLNFGDVSGVWVQTATWALADVRVFGSHILTSEIVDHRNADVVAVKNSSRTRSRRNGESLPSYK